jgi:NADH-quinone oxidoreductase subunit N
MNLWLMAPEIGLASLALLVLALDLIFLRARNKAWLGWLSAAGVGLLLLLLISARGNEGNVLGEFLADQLAFFLKLIILTAAALVCLASAVFASEKLKYPGEFFSLLLFSTLGLMLMASAGDLLMLYLGLELGTISLYALAALQKDRPRSGEAGLKFLIMGAVSSAVFLYGASLMYGSLGTTVFAKMAPGSTLPPPLLTVGLVMVLAAFAFKITAVPFHMWAPDVYEGAPTPVAGFLSVASKAAGFGVLLRLFLGPLFDLGAVWFPMLVALSALSMIVGNLVAIPQTNIKRLLAYSGVAQAGYLLIAVAAGTEKGIASSLFFMLQYVFTNLGAFLIVLVVGSARGDDKITSYAGLHRTNPLLAFCFLVLLLSLGGIPPLSGFWGKLFLFWAGVEQGLYVLVLIGVLATVVSLYYYLMVARQLYIEDPEGAAPVPVPFSAGSAIALCTLAVVILGYPKPWLDLAEAAARIFHLSI